MWVYYVSLCSVFEVTYAFSNVVLATLFSKIIGPRRQVGYLVITASYSSAEALGVFQMSGSIARMTEPILLNLVYAKWGPRGVWLVEIAQLMFTFTLWMIFLKRLVPLEKRFQTKKEVEEMKVSAIA
ncbi:hypothetical protein OSTOST_19863 [Ostertagia ostertagi]